MKVAILSAFPQELKYIRKSVSVVRLSEGKTFAASEAFHGGHELLLLETGMGSDQTESALDYALKEYAPDTVLSLGFGGALYEGSAAGDLIWAERILLFKGEAWGEPTGTTLCLELPQARETYGKLEGKIAMHEGSVITIERRTDKTEIVKLLPDGLQFPVCDMETFFAGRSCLERQIPFFAIRSVTDRLGEEIPAQLFAVSDRSGKYSLGRALGTIMENPDIVPEVLRLGRTSHRASKNLWTALKSLLDIL